MQKNKITDDFLRAEYLEQRLKKRYVVEIVFAILFFLLGFAIARIYYVTYVFGDYL